MTAPYVPPRPTGPPRTVHTTPHRLRVLDGVLRGLTNHQIARELDVTEDTIKCHVRRLMHEIGATNRTHAVHLIYSHQVQVLRAVNQWEKEAS